MPLIFAENENTESGIKYADRTGVHYQFPRRLYKNIIQPGERFIYYRGRKTATSSRAPQVYFGTGIVGKIREDKQNQNLLICDILDYRSFNTLVPFKLGKDDYLESGGKRRGYFQKGVRRIPEFEFLRILDLANFDTVQSLGSAEKYLNGKGAYACPEIARDVDKYAMDAAREYLSKAYPGYHVQVMAKNNPGFDILVSLGTLELYVEVKGTQRGTPNFFLTEGERRFSKKMANKYALLVFYEIDLQLKSHKVYWNAGEITEEFFIVEPIQWAVSLKNSSTACSYQRIISTN